MEESFGIVVEGASTTHWNNVPNEVTSSKGSLAGYGASKHGWGLALDMKVGNSQYTVADSREVEWLEQNAKKFGFTAWVTGEDKKGRDIYGETWRWNYMDQ